LGCSRRDRADGISWFQRANLTSQPTATPMRRNVPVVFHVSSMPDTDTRWHVRSAA